MPDVSGGKLLFKNSIWLLRGGDEKSLAINPHGIADNDGSLATTTRARTLGGGERSDSEWMSVLPISRSSWVLNLSAELSIFHSRACSRRPAKGDLANS